MLRYAYLQFVMHYSVILSSTYCSPSSIVALKIECKMSHLNIAFDRYASIGTVMHYILVIRAL